MILVTQFTGAKELERELVESAAEFSDRAWATMIRYGTFVQDLTQQLAPEDEGFLKANVRLVLADDKSGFEVGWFGEDFAAAGQEPSYWYQEFGTVKMDAQPSLGPAWDELQPLLLADLEADLGGAFS